jgi:hypothetical protein
MGMEKTGFKFPHEKGEAEKDDFEFAVEGEEEKDEPKAKEKEKEPEIEVIDDTPIEDRGRTPMKEPPREFAEDELDKYDESVQKRIKHFTKGYHEERRRAETAEREREEALRIAQSIVEENKKLKGSIDGSQAFMHEQAKKVASNELEDAKRKYKDAYESGDPELVAQAQTELTSAAIKVDRINNFRPPALQRPRNDVQTAERQPEQEVPQRRTPEPRAERWQSENSWYGQNEEMSIFAVGVHTKLVNQGISPRSEEYYEKLDARMRQVFPEEFGIEKQTDAAPPPAKKSNVAPATRSTAPKKIVLTQTQVNIAKRLGVPLELYARKVAEEQMRK